MGRDSDAPWVRALREREEQSARERSQGQGAAIKLVRLLTRAGVRADLVRANTWSHAEKVQAHRWALAFLSGSEDLPLPLFLDWMGDAEWKRTVRR
jgi:hypothetical protein